MARTSLSIPEVDNRQRLIDATIEIINVSGEDAVRVADVVDRVGVTKPTLYHYFGDREGLLDAAQVARYMGSIPADYGVLAEATRAVSSAEEFAETLYPYLEEQFSDARRSNREIRVSVLGVAKHRPQLRQKIREMQDQTIQDLVEALAVMQQRGFIAPHVDLVALMEWGNSLLVALAWMEVHNQDSVPNWRQQTLSAIFHVMGIQKPN